MHPTGNLVSQIIATPEDTNSNGDIFGGWIFSQMDLAAFHLAKKISNGRASTVAVDNFKFLTPVSIGELVSCYVKHIKTGNTSMIFEVEAWKKDSETAELKKVTSSTFTFVAIDLKNQPRKIDKSKPYDPLSTFHPPSPSADTKSISIQRERFTDAKFCMSAFKMSFFNQTFTTSQNEAEIHKKMMS